MASLDRVQSLTAIQALEAAPAGYADDLAGELGDAFDDAALAGALRHVDDVASRVMKILLDHTLADDGSIAAPTRKVFAATVLTYAGKLDVLEDRIRDLAARGRAANPSATAATVVEAARRTIALRDAVRAPVLELVRRLAAAAIVDADRRARDKNLGDSERKKWSATRRDLEVLATQPEAILAASLAARLAAWPEQIDEPEPEREPTLAELIELD